MGDLAATGDITPLKKPPNLKTKLSGESTYALFGVHFEHASAHGQLLHALVELNPHFDSVEWM